MMNKQYFLVGGLSLLISFFACNTEDELIEERLENNPTPNVVLSGSPGSVDFSKYVAVGNSLTAGLMDAALYTKGQQNSFPNILAQQFQIEGIGGGTFNQPDVNSVNGFNVSIQLPDAVLGRFLLDLSIPGPVPTIGESLSPTYDGDISQLNNFGIPGMRVIDAVVPEYSQFNPFFGRIAASSANSLIQQAAAAQGSFFTVWLGGNDVLGWANSGGSAPDGEIDPLAQLTNPSTLTNIDNFTAAYTGVINAMLSVPNAQGVAITIPPVTLLPFYRAVAFNPLPLDQATADALNAAYQQYNGGLDVAVNQQALEAAEAEQRKITFSAGQGNPIVMLDEDLSDVIIIVDAEGNTNALPKLRQSNASDLLLFTIAPRLGQDFGNGPFGLQDPATDEFVLTLNEQITANTRLATFNAEIARIVASTGGRVALLDINPVFADIAGLTSQQAALLGMSAEAQAAADGQRGLVLDGVNYQPDFSPSGIISTDGIHPNPKGHAIVANEVIRVINESFEASIPSVNLSPFSTVEVAP
ncbi:SGNH/GDSL hydrolase family protein [Tunicatimonas pelagia]|uniref:SGNH/GDSL hydrolase family protein n=1 Tax=Tunicatimonas pelagia TaxID=931531 RepID=UPI002665DE7C|nr:SGNH/GDSL hydrolase family protein [Tunicatimonas pelagia]WKN44504.1 SGNH/GDSL hydrolase family protein [Tunicatimonas pelagia]